MNETEIAPSCSSCPWMRYEGNSMRCYHEPPVATFLGTIPSRMMGGQQQLLIAGISPEVHPDRFCRHHPLLADGAMPPMRGEAVALPTHGESEARN